MRKAPGRVSRHPRVIGRGSAISPPRQPPRSRLALPAALILVAALVAAAHWPVLGARALAFDDGEFLTRNPLVTNPGWSSVGRFFGEVLNPSSVKGYYLPLTMTSLMLDYAAGGRPDDLRAFHQTSLALHVLNAALIVLVLHRLFGALIPAAFAGLVFGLHPLTVEPVAWLSQRKTLLASCFGFACLLAYARHRLGGGRWWWRASIVLHAMALMSKPTVVTLPILLLLLDWWPLRRHVGRAVAEKWPFFLLSLISSVIAVVSQVGTMGTTALPGTGPLRMLLQICYLQFFYVKQLLWPHEISSVHPPLDPVGLSNPLILFSVIGVCVLVALLILSLRRSRGPLVAWLFYFVALAPTFGVLVWSTIFTYDSYAYFPALGILLMVAAGLAAVWRSPALRGLGARAALLLPLVALLALEAKGVRDTLRHWSDSLTLYKHMEQVAPGVPAVQAQLGVWLQEAGSYDEAVVHFRRALEIEPINDPDTHFSMAIALAGSGQFDEAIRHFRSADVLRPDDPPTVYNLGVSLHLAGRLEEAAVQFRRVLRIKPDHPGAANELGGVLLAQGHVAEAADQFRRGLALTPTSADLHYGLGTALRRLGGDASEVRDHLRRATQVEPGWPQPFIDLAWLLATSPNPAVRDPAEALRLADRVVAMTGGTDPRVLDTRAAAEAAVGRFEVAVETERRAVDLAIQANHDSLVAGMRERMNLYRRRIPYVERSRGDGPR